MAPWGRRRARAPYKDRPAWRDWRGPEVGTGSGSGMILEICADGPGGVAAAVAGGADRLELCSALELGGLTPSAALLARAVATGLPVHAVVRPRAGGFVLGPDELALALDE